MSASGSWLRTSAALAAGALALHEARYVLAPDAATESVAAAGHGYLSLVAPAIALLVAVAVGRYVAALARPRAIPGRSAASLRKLWLAAGGALLAVHAGQELAEWLLVTTHPTDALTLLGAGAWITLPLAAAVGLAIAVVVRAADAAVARAGERALAPHPPALRRLELPSSADLRPLSVLARKLAGRAPPVASV